MFYIYYKDKLNKRQNKPFIDYFSKNEKELKIVSKLEEIKVDTSEQIYILVGTMEFYEVFLKFFYKKNVKIIYRSRGIAPEESFYRNRSWIRYMILSLIELIVIIFSKHIIVVSDNHKKHYVNKYKIKTQKISVIHNYLTKDSYKLKEAAPIKKEIVYVGGLAKWQKIDDVKKLFKKINLLDPETSFLICTNEENINEAKMIFKEVGNTSFESYNNYNDLIGRISLCTAGVILRDSNKVNICSSPFKIIDYISAQLPVIMTNNIGDYSNLLKDKNFIFRLDNTDFSDRLIKDIDTFLINSFKNSVEIKKSMSIYSCKELDADKEIKEVLPVLLSL